MRLRFQDGLYPTKPQGGLPRDDRQRLGTRNDVLEKKALTVAKAIGKVEVDHGETGCKTPDAAGYIRKTNEYVRAKAAGR